MLDLNLDPRLMTPRTVPSVPGKTDRDLQSLRQSSQEFENLLVGEMLKAMRKSVVEGGLFEKSSAEEMFQEMLDMETIRKSTARQSLGIADAVYRQMSSLVENRR